MHGMRKKHVINALVDDDCRVGDKQQLVKVLGPRGNHLYEVRTVRGDVFLASMPSKFRNAVWIKGGSFVVVESIDEGNKVKAEIVKILLKHHEKQMKKDGLWPTQFDDEDSAAAGVPDDIGTADDDESTENCC